MSRGFKGFLLEYCKELTGTETTSLKKLFQVATSSAPRAFEPLLLLAVMEGREAYLLSVANNSKQLREYEQFLNKLAADGGDLFDFLEKLPDNDRHKKAFLAWRSESEALDRNRKTLAFVADAFSRLLKEKGLMRAEACRRLGLNKGNFYAFLKGDVTRMSRDTAVGAYKRLESL